MVFHFSIIGLKVEFSNVDITLSISTLLLGLMRGILWFIFFIYRHEKLFFFFLRLLFAVWVCFCLILRFCWLQICQYAKIVNYYSGIWTGAQGKIFAAGTSHVKLLHFSVLDKVLSVKRFSLFISKHAPIPELFASMT